MPRRTRADDELRAVSEHLQYEVGMFLTLARTLATGALGDGVLHNAALESFTVHARALLDFLFTDNAREDDVLADDFLGGQRTWAGIRGDAPPILADVRQRVGKEVAHLTYGRLTVTPETKLWLFRDIAEAVEAVLRRFLGAVPKSRLGPSWQARGERDA